MHKDDEVYLRHMLDAAHEAVSFAEGRKRSDLDSDRQLVLSKESCYEVVVKVVLNSSVVQVESL